MIKAAGIGKRFGATEVLHDLSFEIAPGELVGFVGPNGAGKTTTLRILSGFLLADSGEVCVDNHQLASETRLARASIGYMPEKTPLHEDMRVEEFLTFRARLKGVKRRLVRERVDQVIEELELGEVSKRLIQRLSRGFRQRVALADVLVASPKVLLLDEPTTGLDPLQRANFRRLLLTMTAQRSVLFSTHILSEVEAIASRLLVLNKGRIVGDGSLEGLRQAAKLPEDASSEDVFIKLCQAA